MPRTFPNPQPLGAEARIDGCWLGKSIGGTLGLPAEGKMERLHFSFYDPVPTSAPPNDDLELQLVWLHLVENARGALTPADFAQAWLAHIHYMWDEYGRCRWNLRRGVSMGNVGTFENYFQSAMGSPIRSEIWACLFPGDPDSAAYYAAMDASLDHGVEGIAGEVFFAVMQSVVAAGEPLDDAIATAQRFIPETCETAAAIQLVIDGSRAGTEAWESRGKLLERHGSENFTHAPLNVALTVWALLHGGGDFDRSILLAVNGGYDTDCTAATVGAALGLFLGREGIPARWIEPIGEQIFVGPGILDIHAPQTLHELTARTLAAIGKLPPGKLETSFWSQPCSPVALESLPGTIELSAKGTGEPCLWANGELPPAVKRAGGASWRWDVVAPVTREVICLATGGARLFLDDELLIDCPADLPYIPATHRCPEGSRTRVRPALGMHKLRLELNEHSAAQAASVLLAYPNLHLCPWTTEELPNPAQLPDPA